jgi:predicted nuclease of restriction endonuclease-like RecB superfamily
MEELSPIRAEICLSTIKFDAEWRRVFRVVGKKHGVTGEEVEARILADLKKLQDLMDFLDMVMIDYLEKQATGYFNAAG